MKRLLVLKLLLFFIFGFPQKAEYEKYSKWQDSVINKVDTILIISVPSNNPWFTMKKESMILKSKKIGVKTLYTLNNLTFFNIKEKPVIREINEVYRFEHIDVYDKYKNEYLRSTDSIKSIYTEMPCTSCAIRIGFPEGEIQIKKSDIGTKYPTINPILDFAPNHTFRKRADPFKINFDYDVVYFLSNKVRYFIYEKNKNNDEVIFKQVQIIIPKNSY